jgi:hypothetical protein
MGLTSLKIDRQPFEEKKKKNSSFGQKTIIKVLYYLIITDIRPEFS